MSVRGFAYKQYAKNWWWKPMRSALLRLDQIALINVQLVKLWEGQGRGFRTPVGPASAAHFAPALGCALIV